MRDWTWREDRRQAPGCDIRMALDGSGPHVRYLLLLRGIPYAPTPRRPIALVIRCYDSGVVTVAEETWEG